jgi:hypothetical protein
MEPEKLRIFGELPKAWRGETHSDARSYLCGVQFWDSPKQYRCATTLESCGGLVDLNCTPENWKMRVHLRNMENEWDKECLSPLEGHTFSCIAYDLVLEQINSFRLFEEFCEYHADVSWGVPLAGDRARLVSEDFQRERWWQQFWSDEVFFHPLYCDGAFAASVVAFKGEQPRWLRINANQPMLDDAQVVSILETHFDIFL